MKIPPTLVWAWRMAWTRQPRLLPGFLAMSVLVSLLPAVMVLARQGLINAIVAGINQGNSADSGLLSWLLVGAALAFSSAVISNLRAIIRPVAESVGHKRQVLDDISTSRHTYTPPVTTPYLFNNTLFI